MWDVVVVAVAVAAVAVVVAVVVGGSVAVGAPLLVSVPKT